MTKKKDIFSQIHFYLSLALATFPLLPLKIASVLIILWAVAAGLSATKNSVQNIKAGLNSFLLFSSLFWFALIALLYTSNLSEGWYLLEKNLSLLVFPLCFLIAVPHFKRKEIDQILFVFCISTFAITLYSIAMIFLGTEFTSFPANLPFYYRYRTAVEMISGLHPSYFSLLLLFSILYLINRIIKIKWQSINIFTIAMIIIMFVQAIFLASRIPLFAFVLALLLLIILSFKDLKVPIIATLALTAILITSILLVPSISERISEVTSTKWEVPEGNKYNATNIRVGIYKCSVELVKDNWLLGLGYGDIQEHLNKCYANFNTNAYTITPYNTHNIYLNAWLGSGILGFLSLLAMLFVPMLKAIRKRNAIYASFILFFLICGLTENILNRQIGVVFYCYINMLLYHYIDEAHGKNPIE